jgi:predicted lipoprotein with Yx(FWY)xxD motif
MRRILTIGMIAATGWIGAACADEPDPDADLEAVLDDAAADTEVPPPVEADVAEGAALDIGSAATVGEYVTDGMGRAVYVLEGEPAESSTCYDECVQEWPPVVAGDAFTGAAGLSSDLIGTITRTDGTIQLTYAGRALYHYRGDQAPGDTMGHDVTDQWGEWYLLGPDGAPLEGEPAEGEAAGG